jgi:hypothetical protein
MWARKGNRLVHLGPRGLEAGLLVKTSELLPGSEGEIDVLASAAGAEIHDGGLDGVAVVLDLDLLSAPRVGGSTSHNVVGGLAPGGRREGNDHVSVMKLGTASAEATVVVVDGHVDVLVGRAAGAGGSGSGRGVGRRSGRGGGSWLRSRCRCLVGWLGCLGGGGGRRGFSYRLGRQEREQEQSRAQEWETGQAQEWSRAQQWTSR